MDAYRDENKNGTWFCKFSYVNWKGQKLNKKNVVFQQRKKLSLGKKSS